MKEIIEKIKELEKLANQTDSKKQDFEYRQQIRELQRKLQENLDERLAAFPESIPVTITLQKTIDLDTSEFKNWIQDWIEDNEAYDVDLMEEFKDYFSEDFYIDDYVERSDYDYKFGE